MNIHTILVPKKNEFGNITYQKQKYYQFDDNLFNIIKQYLFKRNKNTPAVLYLSYNNKSNIMNQLQYGLFIKDSNKCFTQKELIKITPGIFNIQYFNKHLFINMVSEYKDKIICDVFEPKLDDTKGKRFVSKIPLRIGQEPPEILIEEHDILIYRRTNKKVGTMYIDKKKWYKQVTNNNSHRFKEYSKKTSEFTLQQIRDTYGNHIVSEVLNKGFYDSI
jgi:hypothetical protein